MSRSYSKDPACLHNECTGSGCLDPSMAPRQTDIQLAGLLQFARSSMLPAQLFLRCLFDRSNEQVTRAKAVQV